MSKFRSMIGNSISAMGRAVAQPYVADEADFRETEYTTLRNAIADEALSYSGAIYPQIIALVTDVRVTLESLSQTTQSPGKFQVFHY